MRTRASFRVRGVGGAAALALCAWACAGRSATDDAGVGGAGAGEGSAAQGAFAGSGDAGSGTGGKGSGGTNSVAGSQSGSAGTRAHGGTAGSGAGNGSEAGSANTGEQCGFTQCAEGQYCLKRLWFCGLDLGSACSPFTANECEPTTDFVCGCDGKVYENECAAWAAGTNLDGASYACAPPTGKFACGFTFCETGAEFCLEQYEKGFVCQPLPEGCRGTEPECSCVLDAGGGGAGGATGAAGASGEDARAVAAAWDALIGDLCFGTKQPSCVDDGPSLELDCPGFP